MSSKVGDIGIGVQADIEPLRRSLHKATGSLDKFSDNVKRHSKIFAASFAAMAAAATAATTAIVNSQRKTIDALAKSADALAITTENLQALNHLAELNGVSSEQMAKGLRRMERALGEAARKGGTTADALNDAGLSIQGIINLSPEQQIQQIANALSNVENQSVKASIASDLFGRDGINMLKVLTQLRKDGIEPTAQKLQELGISINRVDAAKVEAANDALFTAQQVMSGIANTVTVELSDYITVLADRFTDAARAAGGFGEEVKSAIDSGVKSAAKFADFLHGIKVAFKGLELIAVAFSGAMVSGFELAMESLALMADSVLKTTNRIISALNEIPGVDIAKIDPFTDSPFMRGLRESGEVARNTVVMLRDDLHDLAMQPLPSDQVGAFLADVTEKANEAAQAVASAASANIPNGEGGNSNVLPFKRQAFGGPLNTQNDEFGFAPMDDPFDPEAIAAKNEEILQLERDLWTNKGAITEHGLSSITGMIESSQGKQAGVYANSFASILGSTATYSKKAFEINKKFAISEAVVKGYQSATAAWSAGMSTGGPQAPFVAAAYLAASLAKTGAQIKAIKAQSFGGGGSGSAGGGTGGASGAIPGASVPQQSNVQPVSTIVNMTVQGDSISRSQFGSITKQLNDEYEAGYRLNIA